MSGTVLEKNVSENEPAMLTPIMKVRISPQTPLPAPIFRLNVLIYRLAQDPDTSNQWIVCVGDKSTEFEDLRRKCSAREQATSTSVVDIAPPKVEPKPSVVLDLFITYSVSKSEYYALKKADAGVFETLNVKLSKPFEKAGEVVKDEVYAMEFEGLW